MPTGRTTRRRTIQLTAALAIAAGALLSHGQEARGPALVLGVAPLSREADTRRQFAPLCEYLARAAGRPCRVETTQNFLAYWQTMRRGEDYNLILDDAHFTDYRAERMGYAVLAKIPGTVTYSLIVPRAASTHDPGRLAGRRIATLGIPSLGAALLDSLFPQASKQPIPVEVTSAEEGFTLLREGKVAAAILPTALARQEIALGAPLRVLLSTEPLPHMALSAAPSLEPELRATLRQALLDAHKNPAGQKMLRSLGIERFDAASASVYKGKAAILQQYWGY
ncbi:MAG: phosphate/phosphite/phosphonate ABC transporter substrate-binding protein [Chromatiales bacterium]|nr:phosphate/phosphite/phosphonate ABC transporter substrate-binding protein [Chromatiales bacterium]